MLIAVVNIYESLTTDNYLFKNKNVSIGDNLLAPFHRLKEYADQNNIKLCTPDTVDLDKIDVFLFIDMPKIDNRFYVYAVEHNLPCYLIIAENGLLWEDNFNKKRYGNFKKIFTYMDNDIDNKKIFKLNYTFELPQKIDKNIDDKKFCCMIASNNNRFINHYKELYPQRIKIIRWFEKKHLEDFDLFGKGWDEYIYVFRGPRIIRAVLNRLLPLRKILTRKFTSYKGAIERKKDILKKYKFSICYENTRDLPGYITEKIFDCFFAGCVPVYWGANNIAEHIPEDCFIDKRKFRKYEELYDYMKNMNEEKYSLYLENIEKFLNSEKASAFSNDCFVDTIIDKIVKNEVSK